MFGRPPPARFSLNALVSERIDTNKFLCIVIAINVTKTMTKGCEQLHFRSTGYLGILAHSSNVCYFPCCYRAQRLGDVCVILSRCTIRGDWRHVGSDKGLESQCVRGGSQFVRPGSQFVWPGSLVVRNSGPGGTCMLTVLSCSCATCGTHCCLSAW